jgi:hypothetical protein
MKSDFSEHFLRSMVKQGVHDSQVVYRYKYNQKKIELRIRLLWHVSYDILHLEAFRECIHRLLSLMAVVGQVRDLIRVIEVQKEVG